MVLCPDVMIIRVYIYKYIYENHLLLDFPFAKQKGEQVTQKNNKTEGEKDQELVSFNIAAETQ